MMAHIEIQILAVRARISSYLLFVYYCSFMQNDRSRRELKVNYTVQIIKHSQNSLLEGALCNHTSAERNVTCVKLPQVC